MPPTSLRYVLFSFYLTTISFFFFLFLFLRLILLALLMVNGMHTPQGEGHRFIRLRGKWHAGLQSSLTSLPALTLFNGRDRASGRMHGRRHGNFHQPETKPPALRTCLVLEVVAHTLMVSRMHSDYPAGVCCPWPPCLPTRYGSLCTPSFLNMHTRSAPSLG